MLWDLIRDFFVQHVFGGSCYNADTGNYDYYNGYLGIFNNSDTGIAYANTGNVYVPIGGITSDDFGGGSNTILFGDWLSTTATAISITIIVVLCCMFVYKIVKLIGGLIR